MSDTDERAAAKFAAVAERFCAWLDDDATRLTREDALRRLAELYAAGIELHGTCSGEPGDVDDPRVDDAEWERVFARAGELPHTYYPALLDPVDVTATPSVAVGDVADDLADIYRNLRGPLRLYAAGEVAAAVWHWRFGFESHWGTHAIDALHVLHHGWSSDR